MMSARGECIIMPPLVFGTGPDNATSIGKHRGQHFQEQDNPPLTYLEYYEGNMIDDAVQAELIGEQKHIRL